MALQRLESTYSAPRGGTRRSRQPSINSPPCRSAACQSNAPRTDCPTSETRRHSAPCSSTLPSSSLSRYRTRRVRRIEVAPGESLQVTVDGPHDGPAVVIIPGLVSPAYAFRHVLPPLAEAGVRVVVVEPLGVGWSSRPGDADYSHAAQAARIAAVLDTLRVSHAVVMAHAVGTAIALRLALARPDLVTHLLLMEGGRT